MEFVAAAALGVPCTTAHLALFADGPIAGKRVLVQGGAGAVGRAAILLATRAGAQVIATASTPEKRAAAREAGATQVFDHRDPDCAARILEATRGTGVDRIVEVDFGANQALDLAVLAPHGVVAPYSSSRAPQPVLDYYPFAYKAAVIRFVQASLLHGRALLDAAAAIGAGLRASWLRLPVAATFPFACTAAAHEAQEAGPMGKVVVTIP